jgi:hypothetical protein
MHTVSGQPHPIAPSMLAHRVGDHDPDLPRILISSRRSLTNWWQPGDEARNLARDWPEMRQAR